MSFAFGDHIVRVLTDADDPWFVLADICRALDIANAGNVAARLRDSGAGVRQADIRSGGQVRSVTAVDESGLYEVIIRSDKPDARKFRRWVTAEVLPAIRKTGSYSRYPAHPTALPSKKELAQWVVEAEERAEVAEARAAELEPSAVAWNRLHELGADFEVADAAKILSRDPNIEIGRNRLYEFMHELDWVFRGRHNVWKAYQDQVDLGRIKMRPGGKYIHEKSGERRVGDPAILITPKGLAELRRQLGATGQLSLVNVS
ncbi:phage antirepressor KilAC domain-containing protein [Mycobacterium hackensackense]|nr:phage antirepressor KilAC domain-containing protein [Mycobacterium hackensackense]